FEEYRAGKYKIISFMAKRARGLMARYAIEKKVNSVKKLERFDREGYAYAPEVSQPDRLVFRRRQDGA
ncbi:MAG: peroxide stress protein YaaA, partial [Betaproteobacteria bacterium]